jgi:hypothetical protein
MLNFSEIKIMIFIELKIIEKKNTSKFLEVFDYKV